MEINEIITYVLTVVVPGIFLWNNRIQSQLSDLRMKLAIHDNKWEQMEKLIEMVEDIDEQIREINIRLAKNSI